MGYRPANCFLRRFESGASLRAVVFWGRFLFSLAGVILLNYSHGNPKPRQPNASPIEMLKGLHAALPIEALNGLPCHVQLLLLLRLLLLLLLMLLIRLLLFVDMSADIYTRYRIGQLQFAGFALCFALCFALPRFALPCFAVLCVALLCFASLYFALLCFASLCFVLLRFALLCLAMPCLASPCLAVPCFALFCFPFSLL